MTDGSKTVLSLARDAEDDDDYYNDDNVPTRIISRLPLSEYQSKLTAATSTQFTLCEINNATELREVNNCEYHAAHE
jgi:hypothetical protein